MRSGYWFSVIASGAAAAYGASLSDVCTPAYIKPLLPVGLLQGVTIDTSSVQTALTNNYTETSIFYPTETISYCNVTFAYSHDGIDNDVVHVSYWLPDPSEFKNRYVSTGGGGWAINSGYFMLPTSIIVGG